MGWKGEESHVVAPVWARFTSLCLNDFMGLEGVGIASGKEFVEVVMRTDPNPDNRVAAAFPHGAVLLINAHGPEVLVASKLLETQRGVAGVVQKHPISAARSLADAGIQRVVSAPEAGPGAGVHSRCGSSGASGSAAESRRKASSFGRGPG